MSKGFEESKYGYLRYMSLKSLVERDNLPGFLSSYLTKKKADFWKKFCVWLFLIRVQKKNVIKKVETETRWDMYLIIYAFPLQKQQGRRVAAFFLVCLLKSQAQNETIWAWDFIKNFHRCDANRWFDGCFCSLRAVSKAAPAFAKADGGSTAQVAVGAGKSPHWGCSWCEIFTPWNHQVIPAPHGPLGGGLLFPHEVMA